MSPSTAIVIAHFEQPGYALESVSSAFSTGAYVVVVDDASSSAAQTELAAICAPYPERLVLLRRATNGGLSAARNTGIDWALRNLPEVRFILPLDSDDIVESRSVPTLEQQWSEAESTCQDGERLGWLYGDATLFGTFEVMSRVPRRFTASRLLTGNFCFSTSFIHRSVFEAGVRYDETLRRGLEDWDFYLSAMEHTYVGRHAGHFGFHYRKHGETMLAETNEDLATVEADVRARHPELFRLERILHLEHTELPRFALLDLDRATLRFLSSPDRQSEVHDVRDGALDLSYLPPLVVAARGTWFDAVESDRMLYQILSALQSAFAHQSTVTLGWHLARDDEFGLDYRSSIRCPAGIAFDATRARADADDLLAMLEGTRPAPAQFQYGPIVPAIPKTASLPYRAGVREALRQVIRADLPPYPIAPDDHLYPADREFVVEHTVTKPGRLEVRSPGSRTRSIGVIAPWIGLGGMDLILLEMARAYAAQPDTAVHLLTTESGAIEMADRYRKVFSSINPVAPTSHNERSVQAFAEQMDILLVANSAKLYGLLPLIRKRTRPAVFMFIQNVDIAADGASVGYLFPLARQYDKHIDGYFVPSKLSTSLIHAFGVDPAKVHVVPNAAVYSPASDAAVDLIGSGLPDRPVRVLYAGRFDRQKGIDRLTAIFDRLRSTGVPFEARLVGKAVLEQPASLQFDDVAVVPPSYDVEVMREHFGWADVVVLPSRWEGLPLVMMDAMRFGLLVITTDVGGIPEYVVDGMECVLVSDTAGDDHVVDRFAATITQLQSSPDDFVDIRRRGMEFSTSITWDGIAADVARRFPGRPQQ